MPGPLTPYILPPEGPRGPAGIQTGFGQITYTDRSIGPEDTFVAGMRKQLLFTPNPSLTVDRLNAPFAGHPFWVGNRIVPRALNDLLDLNVNLLVTADVIGGQIKLDIDVGSPLGPIQADTAVLFEGAGVAERVTFQLSVQVLSFFMANGAALYLTSKAPLTVVSESLVIKPISTFVAPVP